MADPEWAWHVTDVDERRIRFKNKKYVGCKMLAKMWPKLLEVELTTKTANPVVMEATKGQPCVNKPMIEIARRMRQESLITVAPCRRGLGGS
jgi:hypothetical protein